MTRRSGPWSDSVRILREHTFVSSTTDLSPDQKGNVAELAIALEAERHGIKVYRPVGEGGRYDLIFDLGSRLLRVQCKWGRCEGDVVLAHCASSRRTASGHSRRKYTPEEVDALAVYADRTSSCYLLPIEFVGDRHAIQLRVSPANNNQRGGVVWADDHEFSKIDWEALGAVAQMARASGWQPEGRGFDSHQLHSPDPGETIGIDELRNRLGWYAERASRGEMINVTRRGKPYARLLPPESLLDSEAA